MRRVPGPKSAIACGGRFWNIPPVTFFPRCLSFIASLFGLALLLALTVWVRCWNAPDVFVQGKTFFVDPDCYSRMTRVQRVFAHPGTVVHRQEFENWPEGTAPHTTAPFDYLTAGLAGALRITGHEAQAALDLAGAFVSPLLAVAAAAFLWFWGGGSGRRYRGALLLLFAVSPILVHGTVLGRPDHQSLLLLCMAVALGAETVLWEKPSSAWAVAGGLAWGLGLWVSLYEPLVLFVAVIVLRGVWWILNKRAKPETPPLLAPRPCVAASSSLCFWAPLVVVLLLAGWVDGVPSILPGLVVQEYFANWSRTIGELKPVQVWTLVNWTGLLLWLALPVLLWLGWKRRERLAWFWLGLLLVVGTLTCWQVRWGYFLALVFVMALPTLLTAFPRRWMALLAFLLSLWPIGKEWHARWDDGERAMRTEQRLDNLALYDVAQHLRGGHRLPVLAPWWQSPALAYWSGQPCVAGSSHESLPGTVDASRFFLSVDPGEARAILARRRVACVVVYDPERVDKVSSAILGAPIPERSLATILFRQPHSLPKQLNLDYSDASSNASFKVFLWPEGLEQ